MEYTRRMADVVEDGIKRMIEERKTSLDYFVANPGDDYILRIARNQYDDALKALEWAELKWCTEGVV